MYQFQGKVRAGKKRGKNLGFPTANMHLHKTISEGIYISLAQFEKKQYPALTFIGAAKTFGETEIVAETFILDFKRNLYGKYLSVKLLKKIRGNETFENAEKLMKQMKHDKMIAEKYFDRHSGNPAMP